MHLQNRSRRIAPLAAVLLCVGACASAAPRFQYHVLGEEPGSWPEILSSIGLLDGPTATASIIVAPRGVNLPATDWMERVNRGTILIVEGDSPLARDCGFQITGQSRVSVQSVEDLRAPQLRIVWEKAMDLPTFAIPVDAKVFARERYQRIPLLAGYRKGAGAVLWIATSPGRQGYERFPYVAQALADLGLEPPFRSERLWAFFDSAYRSRVDLDYFAARWRASGISALHVAAWHFWERNPQSDEYLRKLIDACHRHAILVYAWVEFPHVSEAFWTSHPEWREKTALLQDAQLDWRKLINLSNPQAAAAASDGLQELMTSFDWDGLNLAEMYFESLEGHDNPARFTPMNNDVRAEFRSSHGLDPMELFDPQSPQHWSKNTPGLAKFLEHRRELARRMQDHWIGEAEAIRKTKPHLDLALTHIDDRFDSSVRDKLAADTSRVLPLLKQHDFTFLIEDPATIWNLGPKRYPQIAARYAPETPAQEKLAIDINVVERYQDVYPTKQQTGTELFELVHKAAVAFPRVALYFENSLVRTDQEWISSAAAAVERAEQVNGKLVIHAKRSVGVPWNGPLLVDGTPWPLTDGTIAWLPAGTHVLETGTEAPRVRVSGINGEITSARIAANATEFAYYSNARVLVMLDGAPGRLEVDGVESAPVMRGEVLVLPRGRHLVQVSDVRMSSVTRSPSKETAR
ncbi:MAG: hypothetical protein ABL967_05495 [Bryobacteraceae bacterium]